MVKIHKNRSYTVHGRSLDRSNDLDTPSNFTLTLSDSIQAAATSQYLKASLLCANIPSSFYQIDKKNRNFTVGFNRPGFRVLQPYLDIAVELPEDGKPTRRDYEREITVTIQKGNYNIEALLSEIKIKLNEACAVAHAAENFRTFYRGSDMTSAIAAEDFEDVGGIGYAHKQLVLCPVFDWTYNKQLNKMKLFRSDLAGKLIGGKWDIQTTGRKLSFCLGFSHVTEQMIRRLKVSETIQTTIENSVHYRETTDTEYNDFTIPTLANSTKFGHAVYSSNTVNMFHNDSVYFRTNLPANGMESLSGGTSNILSIIPITSGQSAENFYIPQTLTSSTIDGTNSVSQLSIRLTDASGELIDFEGGEISFSILFECFDNNTYADKPSEPNFAQSNESNKFSNVHQNTISRHPARLLF
jgi:hypothetical protein